MRFNYNHNFIYTIIIFLTALIAYFYFSMNSDYTVSIYEISLNAKFVTIAVAIILYIMGKCIQEINVKVKTNQKNVIIIGFNDILLLP